MKLLLRFRLCSLFAALLFLLTGCATEMAYRDGKTLVAEGKLEEGLAKLRQAAQSDPANIEYRVGYLNTRDALTGRLLGSAQREASSGHIDDAETLYKRTLALDPGNRRAVEGLVALERARRHSALIADAGAMMAKNDYDGAAKKLALVLLEDPQHADARALKRKLEELAGHNQVISPALRKTFRKPINLEFRDANVKQIVEALSRYSGLNFILDKDVPSSLSTTLFLRQVSVEDGLDVLLTTLKLDKQVLNDNTLLIYPNTAAKQSDHQDLVVKGFYLSNANAKQVMEMLKTVLKAKNLYVDEKLNLLIMRDTPTAIRLAERLVAMADVEEPEVMLEVEIMEVQRSRLQQLGIQFPDQIVLSPLPSGAALTLKDLQTLNSSRVGAAIADTIINLHKDIGEGNILANPRIRTHNREKAEIKIGDRVPVITTTSTATGFVAENVQYVDVGLKLNVEPNIYPNDEVAIKLALEVSSVVKEVISTAGTLSYQIGSRNASTVLRLKDGETQILGGLINSQEQTTANRIPGLGDFPILGRLFSSQKDSTQKTELILSITPHIIRGIAPPPHVPIEFWSGTENNLRLRNLATISAASTQTSSDAPSVLASVNEAHTSADEMPAQVLTGASAATGQAPALTWEGTPQTKVGDTVILRLKVSSDQPITALPVQIKYDPTTLEMTAAAAGEFLAQGGIAADFTKRIVPDSGMAFLTQTRKGNEGVRGDGALLEVRFKALKPAANTVVSVLPTAALAPGNKPTAQTGPALIGISIAP